MAFTITDQCGGCGLCRKMCPVSAISGELKEIHRVNPVRCVDCGVCGRICAKDAVLDANGRQAVRVPRKEWAKPVINQKICSACSICVDACGKNSLSISLPREKHDLRVFAQLSDEKSCVGCGICAKECPLDAISMEVAV